MEYRDSTAAVAFQDNHNNNMSNMEQQSNDSDGDCAFDSVRMRLPQENVVSPESNKEKVESCIALSLDNAAGTLKVSSSNINKHHQQPTTRKAKFDKPLFQPMKFDCPSPEPLQKANMGHQQHCPSRGMMGNDNNNNNSNHIVENSRSSPTSTSEFESSCKRSDQAIIHHGSISMSMSPPFCAPKHYGTMGADAGHHHPQYPPHPHQCYYYQSPPPPHHPNQPQAGQEWIHDDSRGAFDTMHHPQQYHQHQQQLDPADREVEHILSKGDGGGYNYNYYYSDCNNSNRASLWHHPQQQYYHHPSPTAMYPHYLSHNHGHKCPDPYYAHPQPHPQYYYQPYPYHHHDYYHHPIELPPQQPHQYPPYNNNGVNDNMNMAPSCPPYTYPHSYNRKRKFAEDVPPPVPSQRSDYFINTDRPLSPMSDITASFDECDDRGFQTEQANQMNQQHHHQDQRQDKDQGRDQKQCKLELQQHLQQEQVDRMDKSHCPQHMDLEGDYDGDNKNNRPHKKKLTIDTSFTDQFLLPEEPKIDPVRKQKQKGQSRFHWDDLDHDRTGTRSLSRNHCHSQTHMDDTVVLRTVSPLKGKLIILKNNDNGGDDDKAQKELLAANVLLDEDDKKAALVKEKKIWRAKSDGSGTRSNGIITNVSQTSSDQEDYL